MITQAKLEECVNAGLLLGEALRALATNIERHLVEGPRLGRGESETLQLVQFEILALPLDRDRAFYFLESERNFINKSRGRNRRERERKARRALRRRLAQAEDPEGAAPLGALEIAE